MLTLRPSQVEELVMLHDSYVDAKEPDSPERLFADLSKVEQSEVLKEYQSKTYLSVLDKNQIIGFLGLFPDGEDADVSIFYIVLSQFRGRGYLVKILESTIEYCKKNYPNYFYVRAITREGNEPSIRGLKKAGFIPEREILETEDPEISYREYLFKNRTF